MNFVISSRVLGKQTAELLQGEDARALLVIGSDKFTYADLSDIRVYRFMAARNLTTVLATLGVKDTKDVYEHYSPDDLALPHLGAVSLAILGAAFQLKGLGGSAPLDNWMLQHRSAAKRQVVTFHSIKSHSKDVKAAREERRAARQRKARRRNQAHRLRSDRFDKRQTEGQA